MLARRQHEVVGREGPRLVDASHECILDTTWRELSAFSTFEPSIKVFRSTSAESYEMYQNDPDVIILTGVIRGKPR